MKEIWKDIMGYEGLYKISNWGRVYSLMSGKELKQASDKDGYFTVTLHNNGEKKSFRVHRLVANHFISFVPEEGKTIDDYVVNHKDERKGNNYISNLEFITIEANNNYGNRNKNISKSKEKQVIGINKINGLILEFDSIMEASRCVEAHDSHISQCCNGKRNSAGGYIWMFK